MKTRSKLMAAVVMLVVSAIMMSTASFAWFTISTAPEVTNMKTNVAANGNLEIALDNGYANAAAVPASTSSDGAGDLKARNVTWGNMIDLVESFYKADGSLKLELKPVELTIPSTGEDKTPYFSVPNFGVDGRIKSVTAATANTTDGAAAGADNTMKGVVSYGDSVSNAWAYKVDFWVRSNVGGKLVLSAAADRGADEAGLGSTLNNDAVTVVFWDGTNYIEATRKGGEETATDKDYLVLTKKNGTAFGESETDKDVITTLTANTAQKITMFVFVDGAGKTNADLLTAAAEMTLNVQFALKGTTLDGLDVTATGNNRETPPTAGGAGA